MPHCSSIDINELVSYYMRLWWSSDRSLPEFKQSMSRHQQSLYETQLKKWSDKLMYVLENLPRTEQERDELREQLSTEMRQFALSTFSFEQRHLDFIEKSRMVEASLKFVRMARDFDPAISGDDIYQAGRNVMTSNLIQLLLGLKVEVTPSIFAYSMLYPYTDNYLDDPAVSQSTKESFNRRFRQRLLGEALIPKNPAERTIDQLFELIESEWERSENPLVYDNLLAIHNAQIRSLGLIDPDAGPYEKDVLGISFEKGGTSVLADGYLVAGSLTEGQAKYLFGYGAYTQLMDDLEDVTEDLEANRLTIFSQTAPYRKLDHLTNRLIHFGRAVLADLDVFDTETAKSLFEIIDRALDPILIDIIGRSNGYFSKRYLRALEKHSAYRFQKIKKLRKKLERRKITLEALTKAVQTYSQ